MCRASSAVPQPASTDPTFGPTWPNFAVVRGDGEVAQGCKHVATADGEAVDAGDYRLGYVANDRLEFVDGKADDATPIVLALVRALIAAGAKGLVAGPGKDDARHTLVVGR
ncbi:hypothetical protein V1281_002284 [Nitrobacteraceae bacterium AZCC 2161]